MDLRAILCKYRLDLPSVYIMLVCEIKHTQVNTVVIIIKNYGSPGMRKAHEGIMLGVVEEEASALSELITGQDMYPMPLHLTGPPTANAEKKRPQKVLKIEIWKFTFVNLTRERPSDCPSEPVCSVSTHSSHAGLVSVSTREWGSGTEWVALTPCPQHPRKELLLPMELLLPVTWPRCDFRDYIWNL